MLPFLLVLLFPAVLLGVSAVRILRAAGGQRAPLRGPAGWMMNVTSYVALLAALFVAVALVAYVASAALPSTAAVGQPATLAVLAILALPGGALLALAGMVARVVPGSEARRTILIVIGLAAVGALFGVLATFAAGFALADAPPMATGGAAYLAMVVGVDAELGGFLTAAIALLGALLAVLVVSVGSRRP